MSEHTGQEDCPYDCDCVTAQAPDPAPQPLEELLANWDRVAVPPANQVEDMGGEMARRLRAVAKLHYPYGATDSFCAHPTCAQDWPCDTARALAGKEGKK